MKQYKFKCHSSGGRASYYIPANSKAEALRKAKKKWGDMCELEKDK